MLGIDRKTIVQFVKFNLVGGINTILAAVVYVIVLMLTLRAIGVEPGSLLTTSALLTAVIGLSLQDTLGNLFAAISLQIDKPFELDDWD